MSSRAQKRARAAPASSKKDSSASPDPPDARRSPLRYPGGKFRAVGIIRSHIPAGTRQLVAPFLGGGSVELACAAAGMQVLGADAFGPLVVFWRQALRDPARLAAEVSRHHPLAREDFYALQKTLMEEKDPLRMAAAFFVLNRSSFSGTTLSGGMSPGHPRFNLAAIERLRKFRARNLDVRQADYRETIKAHPDKLLYLDPPYAIKGDKLYGERGDMHSGFDHEELAALLKARSGWILSYNSSKAIARLYEGYRIARPRWAYGMSNDKRSREALIICL